MERKQTAAKTARAAREAGEHLTVWRKLEGLTAEQVADRAGISRGTLRRLEHGEPGVRFETFLDVARVLGILDRAVVALDPYETELGRARAGDLLPQRVRQ